MHGTRCHTIGILPSLGSYMDTQEVLIGLAQIAIALIGFSGLVSVFRRGANGVWHPDTRFWMLLTNATGGLFFSLLPLPFLQAALSPFWTWSVCSGIFAVFLAASATLTVRQLRQRLEKGEYYKSEITVLFIAIHVVLVVTLVLNCIGLAWEPTFTPYLASLSFYLFGVTLAFIRLVYVSFSTTN